MITDVRFRQSIIGPLCRWAGETPNSGGFLFFSWQYTIQCQGCWTQYIKIHSFFETYWVLDLNFL